MSSDPKFWRRYLFVLVCVILSIIGMCISAVGVLRPPMVSGTAGSNTDSLVVSEYSKEEIVLTMEKTFVLDVACILDDCYFSVRGKDPINYTVQVRDEGGEVVKTVDGKLRVPDQLSLDSRKSVHHHTDSNTHTLNLSPGGYDLVFQSEEQVSYSVYQGFSLEGVALLGNLLAAFGIAGIILWFIYGRKKKAPTTSGTAAYGYRPPPPAYGQPQGYNPTYSYSYSDPDYGPPITTAASGGQGGSSLEYQQGGFYTELQCMSCGRIVRSRPVNGIVVCEHCGEAARLY